MKNKKLIPIMIMTIITFVSMIIGLSLIGSAKIVNPNSTLSSSFMQKASENLDNPNDFFNKIKKSNGFSFLNSHPKYTQIKNIDKDIENVNDNWPQLKVQLRNNFIQAIKQYSKSQGVNPDNPEMKKTLGEQISKYDKILDAMSNLFDDTISSFKTLKIGLIFSIIITPIFAGFSLISLGFYLYSRKRKA